MPMPDMTPNVNALANALKRPERLTPQHELFVKEYLVDLNATAAYIRAGGSPATADRAAARLMKKGTLTQIAIARAMAERAARVGITADRVLQEVARIAFGDPRVLFREDGALRAPTEYGEHDAAMIEGIKTRRIVEIAMDEDGKQKLMPVEIQEVKLASKAGALGMLMRHLGLNNDKLDVTLNMPLAQALQEAYARTGVSKPQIGEGTAPDGEAFDVEYEDVTEEEPGADNELAELLK